MIDAAIIMVENAHTALEHFRDEKGHDARGRERFEVILC
jgi:Cu(I)/Ag(I) efflux system membrane protein CusA/SilA